LITKDVCVNIPVMKENTMVIHRSGLPVENIRENFCLNPMHNVKTISIFNMLLQNAYNFFTGFPQKMWKTNKSPLFQRICIIFLSLTLLSGCSYFRGTKKPDIKDREDAIISMNEDQVRQRYGEPTMVSKTSSNTILWTYRPSWKIIPDNKGTMYIEFENGKVIKVLKVR